MSEFDGTSLGAVFVNIDTPAPDDSPFRLLAELADHAFGLADDHAGYDPSAISSNVNRFASILYPVDNPEMKPYPIKVVLQQNCPALHVNQVTVDFQTRTAECEGQPNLDIKPEQFDRVLVEIKSYLEAAWKRNIVRERLRLAQENRAWTGFIERLQDRGLIPADSLTDIVAPTGKRCPLCNKQSTFCARCERVICKNEACAASLVIPFQACSQHAFVVACCTCLEVAETLPSLGQCPSCDLWFCSYELTWCLGRPKAISDRQPRTHSPRVSSDAREHPTKVIGCSGCTVGDDLRRCSNDKCWSRSAGHVNVCKSCAPDGGLQCMCEQCWTCDDCKATAAQSCFMGCPRCRKVYCLYECEYIRFCMECRRPTLCDDCIEEEEPGAGTKSREGVLLEAQCSTYHCLGKICGACLETTRCSGCQKAFCSACTGFERCETCNDHFCASCCLARKGRCNKCDCVLKQSLDEDDV
ncbi:hypothetical protein BDN67DRAFT_156610 [Paxillus ammoniavirescens]|nr:hypothetical protein BDN67DRAFT_156610 [Paxillus ammoniavirescens]